MKKTNSKTIHHLEGASISLKPRTSVFVFLISSSRSRVGFCLMSKGLWFIQPQLKIQKQFS